MRRVSGIGGFFFRARDPETLARWYTAHFGIDPAPGDYAIMPWVQEAGPTVFAPFRDDTGHLGEGRRTWMLNLRVRDLDGLVADLRGAGIVVEVDPETHPNGRFARLADPEGNPIELWEPAGAGARL